MPTKPSPWFRRLAGLALGPALLGGGLQGGCSGRPVSEGRPSADAAPRYAPEGLPPVRDAALAPRSAIAATADDASWRLARAHLRAGRLPPVDAVRPEEFLARFEYGVAHAEGPEVLSELEGAPSPYAPGAWLLRASVRAREVAPHRRRPVQLVLVVALPHRVEGDEPGRVVGWLEELAGNLGERDAVAVVACGSPARVHLPLTAAADAWRVRGALRSLLPAPARGPDALGLGLRAGFALASQTPAEGSTRLVLLVSPGHPDDRPEAMAELARETGRWREAGVRLAVVGVGWRGYRDDALQALARAADGAYAYADAESAPEIFGPRLVSLLEPAARDLRITIDFEPSAVRTWRMVGHARRRIEGARVEESSEGGEIGAGRTATALYALELAPGASGPLATLEVHWREPQAAVERRATLAIAVEDLARAPEDASPAWRLAAAAGGFAEALAASPGVGADALDRARSLVQGLPAFWRGHSEVLELGDMIARAERIGWRWRPAYALGRNP